GMEFYIPFPEFESEFAKSIGFYNDANSLTVLKEWFFSRDSHTFHLRKETVSNSSYWRIPNFPSFQVYSVEAGSNPTQPLFLFCKVNPDKTFALSPIYAAEQNEIGTTVANQIVSQIYMFRAERVNVGRCQFGANPILHPDARNLAEVLDNLQNNPLLFSD